MNTFISTILSITLVATIIVTIASLTHRAGLWGKRNKYKKFINPKNTEQLLQDELAAEFQEYINSKQQKSRREHPTNFHRNGLDNETKEIISRIPKYKETPTPKRNEFGKFVASKYRNQPWWGD